MPVPVSVLLILVNEADLWFDTPLYEALVKRLHELGIVGATAQVGAMGFGHHHPLHQRDVFGMSENRPVTITVVDTEANIVQIIPEVKKLVEDGLVLMLGAKLVHGSL